MANVFQPAAGGELNPGSRSNPMSEVGKVATFSNVLNTGIQAGLEVNAGLAGAKLVGARKNIQSLDGTEKGMLPNKVEADLTSITAAYNQGKMTAGEANIRANKLFKEASARNPWARDALAARQREFFGQTTYFDESEDTWFKDKIMTPYLQAMIKTGLLSPYDSNGQPKTEAKLIQDGGQISSYHQNRELINWQATVSGSEEKLLERQQRENLARHGPAIISNAFQTILGQANRGGSRNEQASAISAAVLNAKSDFFAATPNLKASERSYFEGMFNEMGQLANAVSGGDLTAQQATNRLTYMMKGKEAEILAGDVTNLAEAISGRTGSVLDYVVGNRVLSQSAGFGVSESIISRIADTGLQSLMEAVNNPSAKSRLTTMLGRGTVTQDDWDTINDVRLNAKNDPGIELAAQDAELIPLGMLAAKPIDGSTTEEIDNYIKHYSQRDVGKIFQKEAPKPELVNAVGTRLNKYLSDMFLEMADKLNAKVEDVVETLHSPSGAGTFKTIQDLIGGVKLVYHSGAITFEADSFDDKSRRVAEEFQKTYAGRLNNTIQSLAHIEGSFDYEKIYERTLSEQLELFGVDLTTKTKSEQ